MLTKELLQSLRSEVVAASARHVTRMNITFEGYGRIRNMKGISRSQAPPLEEIDNAGGFGDFLKKAVASTGIQLCFAAVLSGLKQLGLESIDEFAQARKPY